MLICLVLIKNILGRMSKQLGEELLIELSYQPQNQKAYYVALKAPTTSQIPQAATPYLYTSNHNIF